MSYVLLKVYDLIVAYMYSPLKTGHGFQESFLFFKETGPIIFPENMPNEYSMAERDDRESIAGKYTPI